MDVHLKIQFVTVLVRFVSVSISSKNINRIQFDKQWHLLKHCELAAFIIEAGDHFFVKDGLFILVNWNSYEQFNLRHELPDLHRVT